MKEAGDITVLNPQVFQHEGQKGGKVGLKIDKPLIKYNLDGKMTSEYLRLQKEVYCESKKL